MSYKTEFASNNTDLQTILETVNTLPDVITPETPTISVSSSGLITATANDLSATQQLTTQAAKTVTPSTSNQTAVASGRYTTGAVTVKGDSNLKAENIASGVSIFGVTGTFSGKATETVTFTNSSSYRGLYFDATGTLTTIPYDATTTVEALHGVFYYGGDTDNVTVTSGECITQNVFSSGCCLGIALEDGCAITLA